MAGCQSCGSSRSLRRRPAARRSGLCGGQRSFRNGCAISEQMQEHNFDEATVAPLLRWLTSHSAAWAMGRMATAVVSSEKSRAARASSENEQLRAAGRAHRGRVSSKTSAATAPTEGELQSSNSAHRGRAHRGRRWPLDAASPPRARMAANTAASRQRQTAALSR